MTWTEWIRPVKFISCSQRDRSAKMKAPFSNRTSWRSENSYLVMRHPSIPACLAAISLCASYHIPRTLAIQTVRKPFPTVQKLRGYKQRGQQTFFRQFWAAYSRFCSTLFAFWHSLKPVFPCTPCLSVAVYVVRRIDAPEEAPYKHNEALYNSLAFHLCISTFYSRKSLDLRTPFQYCIACKSTPKYGIQEEYV